MGGQQKREQVAARQNKRVASGASGASTLRG